MFINTLNEILATEVYCEINRGKVLTPKIDRKTDRDKVLGT